MGDFDVNYIVDKYGDTIKEEINVKDIQSFGDDIKITKVFKPLGSALSAKFAKDTGNIIKYGKMGNITELGEGRIKVFDDSGNEWILEKEDYEISYQGLEGDDVAIDGGVIAKLDLQLTPELEMEGMAREVSRFLNQMRKDVDYNVDDKVKMFYHTNDEYMVSVITKFSEFLSKEALLESIESSKQEGDIISIFNIDEKTVTFSLKK
ncbi:MAG TPA: DUF5915 domain-containing protein [Candidatus Absconditabacterales bacterium]|nr:DUF5915 domain-containing protein [Candidatus Absconditabacterales bacterium]HOQ79373.1 DUF5915 domain-containing protein [Candidatus Absconditabacterales bacterium]HPK27850.1 DUF5915 domain-containing protein [Candidatus Absconditabacterales bacterium]